MSLCGGSRVLSRQNLLRALTAVLGALTAHTATYDSDLARYDRLQPKELGDLTDHRRAPGRAAFIATWKPLSITVCQYVERSDPPTLDTKRFLAIPVDQR